MLAEALPRLVEAGQLIRLYRMVSSPEFRPEGLRTGWQVFTADSVPMFWPAFSMILPFHTSGMDRPQDRADLMRLMRYDPFNFLLFAAAFVEAVDAVASVAPAATPTTTTVVKSQETPTTA